MPPNFRSASHFSSRTVTERPRTSATTRSAVLASQAGDFTLDGVFARSRARLVARANSRARDTAAANSSTVPSGASNRTVRNRTESSDAVTR